MDEDGIQRELITLIKVLLSVESMVDYFGGYVDITIAEAVTRFEEFCCRCNTKTFISPRMCIFGLACSIRMVRANSPCGKATVDTEIAMRKYELFSATVLV